jgi:hypothetical protein
MRFEDYRILVKNPYKPGRIILPGLNVTLEALCCLMDSEGINE